MGERYQALSQENRNTLKYLAAQLSQISVPNVQSGCGLYARAKGSEEIERILAPGTPPHAMEDQIETVLKLMEEGKDLYMMERQAHYLKAVTVSTDDAGLFHLAVRQTAIDDPVPEKPSWIKRLLNVISFGFLFSEACDSEKYSRGMAEYNCRDGMYNDEPCRIRYMKGDQDVTEADVHVIKETIIRKPKREEKSIQGATPEETKKLEFAHKVRREQEELEYQQNSYVDYFGPVSKPHENLKSICADPLKNNPLKAPEGVSDKAFAAVAVAALCTDSVIDSMLDKDGVDTMYHSYDITEEMTYRRLIDRQQYVLLPMLSENLLHNKELSDTNSDRSTHAMGAGFNEARNKSLEVWTQFKAGNTQPMVDVLRSGIKQIAGSARNADNITEKAFQTTYGMLKGILEVLDQTGLRSQMNTPEDKQILYMAERQAELGRLGKEGKEAYYAFLTDSSATPEQRQEYLDKYCVAKLISTEINHAVGSMKIGEKEDLMDFLKRQQERPLEDIAVKLGVNEKRTLDRLVPIARTAPSYQKLLHATPEELLKIDPYGMDRAVGDEFYKMLKNNPTKTALAQDEQKALHAEPVKDKPAKERSRAVSAKKEAEKKQPQQQGRSSSL